MAIETFQPDLDTDEHIVQIAALTPTDNAVIIGNGSAWTAESGSTLRASLGLAIGVDVQAYDADHAAWAGVNPSSYLTTAAAAAAYQPLDADLTSWAAVTRASGFDAFAATPTSANLRALLTDESGSGALLFAGGALGTPASGLLTNCTGLPNASVVGLGTAALVNTGTSGATIPLLNGANTWSATQVMTAALDMRNDVKFTDAGTNRWAVGRGTGGGGATDDFQLYSYSLGVVLRVPYASNIVGFVQTPNVAGDPVMTRGAAETVTGIKTFTAAYTTVGAGSGIAQHGDLRIDGHASNATVLRFQKAGVNQWIVGRGVSSANDHYEITDGSGAQKFRIDSSTHYLWCSGIVPRADNALQCGDPSLRFTAVYATNGSIQTSDMREKTPFTAVASRDYAFARSVFLNAGWYRWLDSIEQKGDRARNHFGVGAQIVEQAARDQGYDPNALAMFCEDAITEQVLEPIDGTDDDNPALREVTRPMMRDGEQYIRKGLRPDQLSMLGIAALFKELETMRARLAALEASQ